MWIWTCVSGLIGVLFIYIIYIYIYRYIYIYILIYIYIFIYRNDMMYIHIHLYNLLYLFLSILSTYNMVSGGKNMLSCEHTGLLPLIKTPLMLIKCLKSGAMWRWKMHHEVMDLSRQGQWVCTNML